MPVRKVLMASLILFSSSTLQADIYAQLGYKNGNNGILLLTEKCPADKTGQLKVAILRNESGVLEGCYLLNNRGNPVVKWNTGDIEELNMKIFSINNSVLATPTHNETDPSDYNEADEWLNKKPLYIHFEGEKSCIKSDTGMFLSPWGNRMKVITDVMKVSNDKKSMRWSVSYEDGSKSYIDHFINPKDCNASIVNVHQQ